MATPPDGEVSLRRLNAGRILADVGWQATFVVGVWGQSAFVLGGGAGMLAGVTASMTTGWLVGALVAGWAIDRFGPRTVMVTCQLLIVPVVLILWGVESAAALMTVVGVLGMLVAPTYMSLASVAPHMTEEPLEFQRINGSLEVAATVAGILGAALGALLVRSVGVRWIFVFHAAVALVASSVFASVSLRPFPERQDSRRRLFDGVRLVYADRLLRRYLVASMIVWLTMSVFETLQPLVIRDGLRAGADALGWLHIVFAVGLIAGSGLIGTRAATRIFTRALPWCMVALGAGMILFATAGMPGAVVGLFVAGCAVGAIEPLLKTAIQARVERGRIGRVVSILEVHDQVAELAPLVALGAATAALGVPLVVAGTGVIAAVAGAAVWGSGWVGRSSVPRVRSDAEGGEEP